MPGMHPRQYLVSRGRNVLYPCQSLSKLLSKCLQNWCIRFNQRLRYKQDTKTVRERVIVFILHEQWRHPLRTFRLCLHVSINAWRASVTYFLSHIFIYSHIFSHIAFTRPRQCSVTVDAAADNMCRSVMRLVIECCSSWIQCFCDELLLLFMIKVKSLSSSYTSCCRVLWQRGKTVRKCTRRQNRLRRSTEAGWPRSSRNCRRCTLSRNNLPRLCIAFCPWRDDYTFVNRSITVEVFGSRPSDHYFRSVCWFVCLFVQSFSQPSLIRFRSNFDICYMSGSSCVP